MGSTIAAMGPTRGTVRIDSLNFTFASVDLLSSHLHVTLQYFYYELM